MLFLLSIMFLDVGLGVPLYVRFVVLIVKLQKVCTDM